MGLGTALFLALPGWLVTFNGLFRPRTQSESESESPPSAAWG